MTTTVDITRHLIDTAELSAELGVRTETLYRWRRTGYGPRFTRVGRLIRYSRPDIDRWLANHTEGTTA